MNISLSFIEAPKVKKKCNLSAGILKRVSSAKGQDVY